MTIRIPTAAFIIIAGLALLTVGAGAGAALYRYGPYARLEERLDSAMGRISELEKRVLEAKTIIDAKDTRIRQLAGELQGAKAQNEALQTEINGIRAELSKRGLELSQTRSQLGQVRGQLGKTQQQLKTEKEVSSLWYTISRDNLRRYCVSLDNEVLLSQNSLKNLRSVERWMELVEGQLGTSLPSNLWAAHNSNVAIAERNVSSSLAEQRDAQSLCQTVQ